MGGPAMTWRVAYNPTDGPVVCSADGHVLGGREWAAVAADDPYVASAAALGRLILHDPDTAGLDSMDAAARAAFEHAAALNTPTPARKSRHEEG